MYDFSISHYSSSNAWSRNSPRDVDEDGIYDVACILADIPRPQFVFLSTFTLCEAVTVGAAVSQYDQLVVLQALAITTVVFLGLTLFTFQSKYDFSSMGGYLFGGLLVLLGTSVVGIFLPFSNFTNMLIAGGKSTSLSFRRLSLTR